MSVVVICRQSSGHYPLGMGCAESAASRKAVNVQPDKVLRASPAAMRASKLKPLPEVQ